MPNTEEFIPEFTGQRETEQVELMLFQHWFMLALPLTKAFVVIIISLAVPIWLHWTSFIFSYGLTTAVYYLWLVFWICYMVYAYSNWYRDRFIITSERVIDINQRGLFSRKVSEVELNRIQNITYSVDGIFATMFNFGTIVIQSAGANDLTLKRIADPAGIQEEITRLVKAKAKDQPVTAEELVDFIKSTRHDPKS
ncbi:MAG: PH domain-containing protein [Patescibacteria group bacterium]